MQTYYYFQHPTASYTFIQKQADPERSPEFIWIDCCREDVVNRAEVWQQEIEAATGLVLNEYHVRDILNLEHPCAFDTLEDYDLLIFRKIITPDDHIAIGDSALEQHESLFGLATTPMSFVMTPRVLISIREQGNKSIENFMTRIETIVARDIDQQNKPRKLATSPIDLALRMLNSMIDDYLDVRVPLTKRVEY